jgi:murein DD-endopeptidase MepM/ murein hydrolase activator NlpD
MMTMGHSDHLLARASRRATVAAAVIVGALTVSGASAQALPGKPDPGREKKRVDVRVDRLRGQIEDTSVDLSSAYTALRTTQSRIPVAREAFTRAQSSAAAADRFNTLAAEELEVAQASERKAERELRATTREVAASRARVAQFAAQIYQEQGFGQLDMALSSSDPQQFADRIALADTVLDVQNRTMERLTTEQANLTAMESRLSALRADSAAKKDAAKAALDRARAASAAAERAKVALDALAVSQESQATTLRTRLAAERTALEEMEAEQRRLSAILAKRAADARRRAAAAKKKGGGSGGGGRGGGGRGADGYLSRPMTEGRVSSEFGFRLHPILNYRKLHKGRDYAAPCGTPVLAAADGEVIEAGRSGSYGNRVVIDHGLVSGDGLATTYSHLSGIKAGGGRVSRGEVIGYEGSTGRSTGCHLHFETLQNGSFVDPRRWL